MPCRDDRDSCVPDNSKELKTIENLKKIINMQDTMLCSACRQLESSNYDFDLNPRLSEWWDEHKKEDEKRETANLKKRLQKEQALEIAKKPFNKLTAEDKILLRKEGLL